MRLRTGLDLWGKRRAARVAGSGYRRRWADGHLHGRDHGDRLDMLLLLLLLLHLSLLHLLLLQLHLSLLTSSGLSRPQLLQVESLAFLQQCLRRTKRKMSVK